MALNTASTGPSPVALADVPRRRRSRQEGLLRTLGAGDDPQVLDLDAVGAAGQGVVHQGDDVVVEDVLLLVGQFLEALEGLVQGVLAQLVAQVPSASRGRRGGRSACPSPGWWRPAHVLGPHDLVGLGVLQHPVLVDAALVGEGVLADDALLNCTGKPVIAET
jgi:hypothetical protein